MVNIDGSCPYGAETCPKLVDVVADVKTLERKLTEVTRLLYVTIGMLMIELGVIAI